MSTTEGPDTKRSRVTAEDSRAALSSVTVHVVRHGQVDNPKQLFYGRLPGFDLRADGREQARQAGCYLADSVRDPSSTLVVSSPMLRAQTTAQIIRECLGVEGDRIEEALNEVRTPHEGKTLSEMAAIEWQIYSSLPGWEQFADVGKRVVAGLRALAAEVLLEGSHREVVVTTHGDCVAVSRLWGSGRDFTISERTRLQDEGYPTYCSVTSLQIDSEGQCVSMRVHEVIAENPDGKKS